MTADEGLTIDPFRNGYLRAEKQGNDQGVYSHGGKSLTKSKSSEKQVLPPRSTLPQPGRTAVVAHSSAKIEIFAG